MVTRSSSRAARLSSLNQQYARLCALASKGQMCVDDVDDDVGGVDDAVVAVFDVLGIVCC